VGPPELSRAGALALLWVDETDELDPVMVQRIQNVLKMNGEYDAALQLIDRYRESIPPSSPAAFVNEELQILVAARRFPEVIERAERLLASDSVAAREFKAFAIQMRDEALSKLRELARSEDQTEEIP
jgi:hypothetical protein